MSKNQTVEKKVENQYIFKYPLDGKTLRVKVYVQGKTLLCSKCNIGVRCEQ